MPSVPLRRNRDFTALWVGQTASALGTSISSLAYPLLILAATGSPALAGLVGTVLAAVTFVLRIPAGAVVDRVDGKRLMLVCDAARFLAVGGLAAAVFAGRVLIAHVLLVAACEATFGVLFGPAETIAARRVVADDQVRHAVAVNQSRQQLAGLLGPTIGTAMFGVGRALPFLADALSYLISFIAVAGLRTPLPAAEKPREGQRLWPELLTGLRWLWAQPFLRAASLAQAGAGLLFTSLGLVTLVLATELGATPVQIGLVFTIAGSGGLLGALLTPRVVRLLDTPVILIGYVWIASVAALLLLVAQSVWLLGIIGALAFLPLPAVNTAITAGVVGEAPDGVQGRAVSATMQLTTLFHPIGPALAGVLIEAVGIRTAVAAYGAAFVLLAVAVTLTPVLRHPGRRQAAPSARRAGLRRHEDGAAPDRPAGWRPR